MDTMGTILMVFAGICVLSATGAPDKGRFSFRYFPRPQCPARAVCAEVNVLSKSTTSTAASDIPLFTSFICKCPDGEECPTRPGTHTLHVSSGRWYSVCKPICSLKKCERNQVAEEFLSRAKDFGGRNYRKINCRCPGHENSDMVKDEDATRLLQSKTGDERASVVFQRVCSDYHSSRRRSEGDIDVEELERLFAGGAINKEG